MTLREKPAKKEARYDTAGDPLFSHGRLLPEHKKVIDKSVDLKKLLAQAEQAAESRDDLSSSVVEKEMVLENLTNELRSLQEEIRAVSILDFRRQITLRMERRRAEKELKMAKKEVVRQKVAGAVNEGLKS